MLQGNAIKDHLISIVLEHKIPKEFVGRLFLGRRFTLCLPDYWYNDFCGFSICVVTQMIYSQINIVIKQEVDEEEFLFELSQEFNEVGEPKYDGTRTYLGYVSLGSLRHTTYTVIEIELDSMYGNSFEGESYVGAKLVPRKGRGDEVQTTKVATDSSGFWYEELDCRQSPFSIQHESKSCIKLRWLPS